MLQVIGFRFEPSSKPLRRSKFFGTANRIIGSVQRNCRTGTKTVGSVSVQTGFRSVRDQTLAALVPCDKHVAVCKTRQPRGRHKRKIRKPVASERGIAMC